MNDIVIFEADSQQVEVRFEGETLWLSLQQLADLFGRDKSVISRHLKNIFETNELERERAVAKNATVQREGERKVVRQVEYFNLDAIISVGYRVNSTQATRFRQWATRVLREHLTQGFYAEDTLVQQITADYLEQRLGGFDFDAPENSEFRCVRELWVKGNLYRRRVDIIGFVIGLPLLSSRISLIAATVRGQNSIILKTS